MGFVFSAREELRLAQAMRNYNESIASFFAAAWETAGRGDAVLDFGAGVGAVTRAFVALTGTRPLTLDVDAHHRELLEQEGFRTVDSLESVPAGSFSLVVSSNVLEHIEDDAAALHGLHAALRPGGVLALYLPAFPLLFTEYDRKIGHHRRYTRRELSALVRDAGFELIDVRYQDSLGFLAGLAYRALHGRSGTSPTERQLAAYDRRLWPVSRWLDAAGAARFVGKNLALVARKAAAPPPAAPR